MRTPGFTAEASLYQTNEHYHIFRTLGQCVNTLDAAIVGQVGGCNGGCLDDCNSSFDIDSCREQCQTWPLKSRGKCYQNCNQTCVRQCCYGTPPYFIS